MYSVIKFTAAVDAIPSKKGHFGYIQVFFSGSDKEKAEQIANEEAINNEGKVIAVVENGNEFPCISNKSLIEDDIETILKNQIVFQNNLVKDLSDKIKILKENTKFLKNKLNNKQDFPTLNLSDLICNEDFIVV